MVSLLEELDFLPPVEGEFGKFRPQSSVEVFEQHGVRLVPLANFSRHVCGHVTHGLVASDVDLEEGDVITQDIYAGAGQCDITKGTLVGQATIDNANGIISITMYGDYYMNDLHLNIGEQLPSNLIANGNFNSNPSSWDPQTYTTSYDVLAGGYVIIHVSVWE